LNIARDHIDDEILKHTCCSELGPVAFASVIDFEDNLTALTAYGA
jgi:hypothetical protein